MKRRHPPASLRVPGAQSSGMRRIMPGGAAPSPLAIAAPTEGGAAPHAPTPHQARHRVTKVKQSPSRASRRRPGAASPPAPTSAITLDQTVAALMTELSFTANQPGSYQRMGGF